jgi:hypothetical protein
MLSIVQKAVDNLKASNQTRVDFNLPSEEQMLQFYRIIMELVNALKACKKTPEQATTVVKSPRVVEKRLVKRAVRNELGFFKNWREGDEYYDAVVKAGYEATLADVVEAYNAN